MPAIINPPMPSRAAAAGSGIVRANSPPSVLTLPNWPLDNELNNTPLVEYWSNLLPSCCLRVQRVPSAGSKANPVGPFAAANDPSRVKLLEYWKIVFAAREAVQNVPA